MTPIWAQAALIFGLALAASLLAHRYRLSTALVEILVGLCAQAALGLAKRKKNNKRKKIKVLKKKK
jgi:Kef-type K+ transport system membrane component KefB